MMRRSLMAVLAVGVVAQIGCASEVMVYEPGYPQRYSTGEFFYAARGGEMRVDVRGNPFAMAPERFADRVLTDMAGATRGPNVNFTTSPSGAGSEPYRVVMLFNAGPAAFGDDACAETAGPVAPYGDRLTLLSVFCNGDVALAESEGWAYGIAGPDDAKFRKLVRAVALALIPTHEDTADGDSSIMN